MPPPHFATRTPAPPAPEQIKERADEIIKRMQEERLCEKKTSPKDRRVQPPTRVAPLHAMGSKAQPSPARG